MHEASSALLLPYFEVDLTTGPIAQSSEDNREPLGSIWATRHALGGSF